MKKRRFLTCAVLLFSLLLLLPVKGEAGWKNYSAGRRKYYVTSSKKYVKKSWYKIKGKWFYFDKKGWVQTGRIKVDGIYYYCDKKNGRVTNKRIGNYYYDKNGVMVKKLWVKNYYYGANGKAKYGQFTVKGKTYYCTKEKGKLTNWWQDKHYYDEDGVMATDMWIGDSYVNAKGNITKGNKNPKNPPSEEEVRLLAALVYLEAGNQSYYGKQCVASVVVNRMESKRFPNTLKGVIYQSGQFDPAMNGSLDILVKSKKKIQSQCVKAARSVLTKGSVLKGYYFFNPYWGSKKIGDHYFS